MKKFFALFFLFNTLLCYSQTWIQRDDEQKLDFEYTQITENEFFRLVQQFRTTYNACGFQYVGNKILPVVSGSPPQFVNGSVFARVRYFPHNSRLVTDSEKGRAAWLMAGAGLQWDNNGRGIALLFGNNTSINIMTDTVPTNSTEFDRMYNQYISYIRDASAQNSYLQRGIYESPYADDQTIRIFSNMDYNYDQRNYVPRNGYYVIEYNENNVTFLIQVGQIRANKIYVNLNYWFSSDGSVVDHETFEYSIESPTSFSDMYDDIWIWRRDIQ